MTEPITKQELVDASLDAATIEQAVNGSDTADVVSRLGQTFPTMAKAVKLLQAAGGFIGFTTKANLLAYTPTEPKQLARVHSDNDANNGDYYWNGSAWLKSPFEPFSRPTWTGKKNGWLDPFFRHSAVGVDFLGRQRWRSLGNTGFAPASFVPSAVFDGNALRRTGGGTTVQCGPLLWLDEIGAVAGDTITIYALVSGAVGRDAYIVSRFYNSSNVASGSGIAGADSSFVSDSGSTGIILSAAPQRLRLTYTVPAAGVAVVLAPYSTTMTALETFDIHALWAFKGAADKGPNWPTLQDEDYIAKYASLNRSDLTVVQAGLAAFQNQMSLRGGVQLAELKKSLTDPLTQFVGIVLLGDSITWGMTVTGGALTTPRYGTLQDTRNNDTSPSWANLLHKFLGTEYYEDSAVTSVAWTGSDGGLAEFNYSKVLDLFPGQNPFTYLNNYTGSGPGIWSVAYNASTTLGYHLNGQVNSSGDDMRLKFTMTGTGFDLLFAVLPDGAKYELLVNSVSQGIFSTQAGDTGIAVSYKNVRSHSLGGFVRSAAVELRLIPGDVARKIFKIESIRVTRTLRVTNQGIIGTNANRYATLLVNDAVRSDDSFAFIQLGTNDRAEPSSNGYPETLTSLYVNLGRVVDAVITKGSKPILIAANAATNNAKPTYKFDMSDVRSAIRRLAFDRQISFIDQFAETRSLIAAGDTSWLADGLHPNDLGHSIMFKNIKKKIDQA